MIHSRATVYIAQAQRRRSCLTPHSAESFEAVGKVRYVRVCLMTWGTERTNVRDITVYTHASAVYDPSRLREYKIFPIQNISS